MFSCPGSEIFWKIELLAEGPPDQVPGALWGQQHEEEEGQVQQGQDQAQPGPGQLAAKELTGQW